MHFTHKDLDALLWEWAQETLKAQDSGYPSSYELSQRVDNGIVFIPDYFPHPKICKLADSIFSLETSLRNVIIGKYLFCWKIQEIARYNECHNATIYRYLDKARGILLDDMRKFAYKSSRL